jgi:hypothetical protein
VEEIKMPNDLQPPNFQPSWLNGQRRHNFAEEAIWLVIITVVMVWVVRHWYLKSVRALVGLVVGVVFGLVVVGSAFNGNGDPLAVSTTVLASLAIGGVLGTALVRFGHGTEVRHQTGGRHAA